VARRMLVLMAVNPSSRRMLVLVALGAVAGCGGSHPLQVGGDGGSAGQGGAGQDGGGPPDCGPNAVPAYDQGCDGGRRFLGCGIPGTMVLPAPADCAAPTSCANLDEPACDDRTDCQALHCPNCNGGPSFVGCAAPGGAGVACGACPLPPSCTGLDEKSCTATPGCAAQKCSTCGGTPVFSACYRTGETPPICLQIPCPQPAPCAILPDEAACKARGDCHGLYCPDCTGGLRYFGCGAPGTAIGCDLACPTPVPCANVTTVAACDARTDCHSVFVDPGNCRCATVGCCAGFSRCADGGKAACKGPTSPGAVCMVQPPFCSAPAYVTSYTATCYEGCVRPTECAP
jgi:hypothetical protein